MSQDPDPVQEFLIESYENLDMLDRALVDLEQDPTNTDTLASIFRTIHTIKGTCGFLAFNRLEKLSHTGENLLSKMRDGQLRLNAEITTALLAMVDAIRQMLARIEATGTEGEQEYPEVVAELKRLHDGAPAVAAPAPSPAPAVVPVAVPLPAAAAPLAVVAPPAPVVPASAGAADPSDDRRTGDDRRAADSSLRVDVTLLDKLMNLVGELVLARNQILQFTATQNDSSFNGATQRLNLVTSELQEGVMKTRMQPIGNIWSKFPRIVRDLSVQCGKQVRIEMEGKDTELDKTIVEAIKDPLTHVVRNAVDHGIESPEARTAKGKAAEGVLRLHAYHEGGQINIEITDDGAGIDPARIRAKAVQRGLVSAEIAGRMSDHEVVRMVFLPGFSTAEQISNISGRGVGMDVVKTNIEKIGGQVDIQSRIGEGTTLKVKIPLTLAIIPALMVAGSDGERFAIPQVSLLELVRLEGDQARRGVERIHGARFYRLRGNLLPLVDLDDVFGMPRGSADAEVVNIVVLKADDRQFGLVVSAIHDTEEIVVKPLGALLKGVDVFAGATILGDGHVALILDVLGIATHASIVSEVRDRHVTDTDAADGPAAGDEAQTMLVCRVGESQRAAIPLRLVARLEEFPATAIEYAGGQPVVQYRGHIMPLVDLGGLFQGAGALGHGDTYQVVVHGDGARAVGLAVAEILDIVTEPVVLQRQSARHGVSGAAVLQQRVTDVVDVEALVGAVTADDAAYAAAA